MVHCVRIYSSIGELVRLEKRERRIILLIDSFNWMFGGIGNERKEFLQEVKEINLLQQALGILDWDTQTGMPEKASAYRSEVDSYLYSIYFSKNRSKNQRSHSLFF